MSDGKKIETVLILPSGMTHLMGKRFFCWTATRVVPCRKKSYFSCKQALSRNDYFITPARAEPGQGKLAPKKMSRVLARCSYWRRTCSSSFAPGLPDGTHIFKPKIPIWVNFGGSYIGRYWHIFWPLFWGHLVYFEAILVYFEAILVYFEVIWYFLHVLECWKRKIWQPCFAHECRTVGKSLLYRPLRFKPCKLLDVERAPYLLTVV
jgi:hypothetical protein